MSDPTTTATGAGVRVHLREVLDKVHARYAKQVAMLVQENSELQAAYEAVQGERDELAAKLAALTPAARP
jgi:uncharacterized protein YlxW (UPF0749 family)